MNPDCVWWGVSYPAVAPETLGQTRHRAIKGLVPPRSFVRVFCLNVWVFEYVFVDHSLMMWCYNRWSSGPPSRGS